MNVTMLYALGMSGTTCLPIYMVAYLKKEVIGEVIYDVDLEGIG